MPYYAKRDDHVVVGEKYMTDFSSMTTHTHRLVMIIHTVAMVVPVYKTDLDVPDEVRAWEWAEKVKQSYWCPSKRFMINWIITDSKLRPGKRNSANVLLNTIYGNKLGLRR